MVGDASDSNLLRAEDLNNPDVGNLINGVNTSFNIVNFPVVQVTQVVVDGVPILSSAYEVEFDTGTITLTTPPTETAFISYFFYLMNDNDWTEFVTYGVQAVGFANNNPLAIQVPSIPEGLLPAVKDYAAASWCYRLANQTGLWYNQRLQERVEDRLEVSGKFQKMGDAYSKEADAQRDEFYKGQGQQFRPAFAILNHTPRPYTPHR